MQTMQQTAPSALPTPSPIPTPEPSREYGYPPGIHYLQGGIPIAVPPGGMVETFDHGEGYDDECAAPSIPLDIDTSYPEGSGEVNGQDEAKDLLELAKVWEERIGKFLKRDYEKEGKDKEIFKGVQEQTKISLGVVEEALNRWRFDEIGMSFNGGKDCLVMLIIFLAGVSRWYRNKQQSSSYSSSSSTTSSESTQTSHSLSGLPKIPTAIPCVYVMSSHPFPEVDSFVSDCVHTYHLTVHRYPIPMKTAFATYLSAHPRVQAILVGTRRTDPHGSKLGHFDTTDGGWPKFVRCQPVIDWHYREIWAFLRELEIPYCSLYDLGYTSLGGTTDTKPNPKLALDEEVNGAGFRPAYELMNDDEERLGRD